jgi:lantibiotic modifying enzyme
MIHLTSAQTLELIATADKLGAEIVGDAMWSGDRCSWLYHDDDPWSKTRYTYRNAGVDLYCGVSGIGLALGQLGSVTSDKHATKSAKGAAHQINYLLRQSQPTLRDGLYLGQLGALVALQTIGDCVGLEGLAAEAVSEWTANLELSGNDNYDVISGSAGVVIGALELVDDAGGATDEILLDLALKEGEKLLRDSAQSKLGRSWRTINAAESPDLCGYSHGTSGIGFALILLFERLNDVRFLDAACECFDYERHHFSSAAGNWPDLRPWMRAADGSPPYSDGWCHGASGSLVARYGSMVSVHTSFASDLKVEAVAALKVLSNSMRSDLDAVGDLSLCHGMIGIAEAVTLAARPLGRPDLEELAREKVLAAIHMNYRRGTLRPALMLGSAGLVHGLLRLAAPKTVKSVIGFGIESLPRSK